MEITPKKCVYIYEGEIDYDQKTDGNLPLILIEDKSFSWNEFGEYLMRYEGFKIKIEMIDE